MSRKGANSVKPYLDCTYEFRENRKVGKMRQNEANQDIPASLKQA
jgi:hypothetical protein